MFFKFFSIFCSIWAFIGSYAFILCFWTFSTYLWQHLWDSSIQFIWSEVNSFQLFLTLDFFMCFIVLDCSLLWSEFFVFPLLSSTPLLSPIPSLPHIHLLFLPKNFKFYDSLTPSLQAGLGDPALLMIQLPCCPG